LNTSANRYTATAARVSVQGMSDFDTRLERPEQDIQPVSVIHDEDVPARRLLAHDMEHLVWDVDGERAAPPPD
jgi:hypothetical protein